MANTSIHTISDIGHGSRTSDKELTRSANESSQDLVQLMQPQAVSPGPSEVDHTSGVSSAAVSRVTYVSDPPLMPPNFDDLNESDHSGASEAVASQLEHKRLMADKDRDIELLQLTGLQLEEMVDPSNGYGLHEYFDVKYFASETRRCWEHRMVMDPLTRQSSPKLFPRSSSPLRRLEGSSEMTQCQFEKRHPLMFRNVQRNQARRKLFEDSMSQKASASTASAESSALSPAAAGSTLLDEVRSRVMGAPPLRTPSAWSPTHQAELIRKGSMKLGQRAESPKSTRTNSISLSDPQEWSTELGSAPSTPMAASGASTRPPSLKELLKQQQECIDAARNNDEKVYKPLLESFYRYDENAKAKLDRLAAPGTSITTLPTKDAEDKPPTAKPNPNASLGSTQRPLASA